MRQMFKASMKCIVKSKYTIIKRFYESFLHPLFKDYNSSLKRKKNYFYPKQNQNIRLLSNHKKLVKQTNP